MPELKSPFSEAFGTHEAACTAAMLRAVADPVRLHVLHLLRAADWVAFQTLVQRIDYVTQPTITHHVKILAAASVVEKECVKKPGWSAGGVRTRVRLAPGVVDVLGGLLHPAGAR